MTPCTSWSDLVHDAREVAALALAVVVTVLAVLLVITGRRRPELTQQVLTLTLAAALSCAVLLHGRT